MVCKELRIGCFSNQMRRVWLIGLSSAILIWMAGCQKRGGAGAGTSIAIGGAWISSGGVVKVSGKSYVYCFTAMDGFLVTHVVVYCSDGWKDTHESYPGVTLDGVDYRGTQIQDGSGDVVLVNQDLSVQILLDGAEELLSGDNLGDDVENKVRGLLSAQVETPGAD